MPRLAVAESLGLLEVEQDVLQAVGAEETVENLGPGAGVVLEVAVEVA